MNPRMDEVGEAVRRLFPLLGSRYSRHGSNWILVLTRCGGAIGVTLDNEKSGQSLTFSVADDADPREAVDIAAAKFRVRLGRVTA